MSAVVKRPGKHILESLMGDSWAITKAGFDKLVEIAERANTLTPEVLAVIEQHQLEALSIRTQSDGRSRYTTRAGDMALLSVKGPIVRYADMFEAMSGATSLETLSAEYQAALSDNSVGYIAMVFDTPGGQVNGVNEFAISIRNRVNRKPVVAYISHQAGSAGYWIAAACDSIVIEETASAGSIGVRAKARKTAPDPDEVEVISKRAPRKAFNADTPEGLASMQAAADHVEQIFVDAVAKWRNVTSDEVTVAQGDMLIGINAVNAKLADRLGTMETVYNVLHGIESPGPVQQLTPRLAASKENHMLPEDKTSSTVVAAAPNTSVTAEAVALQLDALRKENDVLRAKAALADEEAKKGRVAIANAYVDGLERDGKLSGDSTTAFRALYVAAVDDVTVKPLVEALGAALPKLAGQERISTALPPPTAHLQPVTIEDLRRAAIDPESSRRVSAALKERVAKNASFTIHDLERELLGKK